MEPFIECLSGGFLHPQTSELKSLEINNVNCAAAVLPRRNKFTHADEIDRDPALVSTGQEN